MSRQTAPMTDLTDAPRAARRQRLTGIALMCGAVACFACLDTTAKYLNGHMDTLQVVWARYTGAFLLAFAFSNPLTRPGLMRTRRPVLQVVRSFLLAASTVLNFLALRYLQLDQTMSIIFSTPFMVAALAGPMLGERIGWRRWTAISVGFAGVLVAMIGAPSVTSSPLHAWGVASVVFSAVTFSVAMVLLRDRAKKDGPIIVGLLSSLMPGLFLGPPAILLSAPPHWEQWWAFLLLGALAAIFMYLLSRAYAHAEAQQLAPIHYTELLWATFMGFVIFHETPRISIFFGAGLIVAACLYSAYDSRRLALKPEPSA